MQNYETLRTVGMYTCRCALVHLFRVHAYLHARSTEQTSDSDVLQGLVILKYFLIILLYLSIRGYKTFIMCYPFEKNWPLEKKVALLEFFIEQSYEEMFDYQGMVADMKDKGYLTLSEEEEKQLMLELDAVAEEHRKHMPTLWFMF